MSRIVYITLLLTFSTVLVAQSQTNVKLDPIYTEKIGDYLPFVIKFQPQSSTIGPSGMKSLKDVVKFMKNHKKSKLVAIGYSKTGMNTAQCHKIAEQRALAVKKALEKLYPDAMTHVIYNSGGIDEGYMHSFTGSSDVVVFHENDFESYNDYVQARVNASGSDGAGILARALIGAMFDSSMGETSCSYCNGTGSVGGELCPRCGGNRTQFSEDQAWEDAGKNINQALSQASSNIMKQSGNYKSAGLNGYQVKEYSDGLYEGYLVNGKRNGPGIFHWKSGECYTGQWKNDKREGRGMHRKSPGEPIRHVGQYINGKLEGEQAEYDINGDIRIGLVDENGRFAGKGKMIYSNGSIFVGNFHYGYPEGMGTLTYKDGSRYVGSFRSGFFHGSGILNYADGSRDEGTWRVGSLTNGIHTFPNGSKYEGEFKKGTGTGKGIFYLSDGASCECTFVNYSANGWGTFKDKDGSIWHIEYTDNKGNGLGCFFDVKNKKYIKGIWKDSKLESIIEEGSLVGIDIPKTTIRIEQEAKEYKKNQEVK
ncbi:MAG: OmpA family protein [Prevotella sp.]|nr:OmpA family protein [Prevotella sp.]